MRKIIFCTMAILAAMVFMAEGISPLRLHVIANSNSLEDQQLKLHVRDQILLEKGDLLEHCRDKEQAMEILAQNVEALERAANQVIAECGEQYQAQVQIGKSVFPDKCYGSIRYPAGEYDAVRIVLGEGRGENWWCVMFPPLCLVQTDAQPGEEVEYTSLLLTWLEGIFS